MWHSFRKFPHYGVQYIGGRIVLFSILTFSNLREVGVAVGDAARAPDHGVVAGEPVDGGELLIVGRHSKQEKP